MMIDYRQIAKSSQIFSGLNEQEKEILLKDGKIRNLSKKEFLFRHADPSVNFYIICSGAIQIFRSSANGVEKTLDILVAKDIICGSKIYEPQGLHQFSAMAVSEAVVLEFPKIWLRENAKKYGDFALNLLATISYHSQMAELEAEHKATMSVVQLVACFLQKLCLIYDFNCNSLNLI